MSQLTDNLSLIQSCKEDIKSAIEAKGVDMTGVSFPGYAAAIGSISGGGGANLSSLSVTLNGTYTPDQGYDGFNTVHVSVAGGATLSSLSVSSNGTYTPETGYDGFSTVTVSVAGGGFTLADVATGNYGSTIIDDSTITAVGYGDFARYIVYESNIDFSHYTISKTYALTSVNLPNCSIVGNYAFRFQGDLLSLSLPVCEYIGAYAFTNCFMNGGWLDLPNCLVVMSYAFSSCSLYEVSLGNCIYIGTGAFGSNFQLTKVYVSGNGPLTIMPNAFTYCTGLSSVILAAPYVASLEAAASSVFRSSPIITQGLGGFWVNDTVYSDYLVASRWQDVAYLIHPMSELQ